MVKRKATAKLKAAPKQPVAEKRKRADISDHYKQSKRAKISKTDSASPTKTTAIKRETQECDICVETKPVYRNFPSLPTCSHNATVCSNCYETHFVTRINEDREQGWAACTCPSCGEKVEPKDAQSILPRHISKDLNTMIANAVRQTAENWVWCPGRNCGRGQLHLSSSSNKVTCRYCRTESCYKHQCVWHKRFTCDEFDQTGDHDANTVRSVAEIQRTTKPCPHCKARIKKDGGCNHMKCTGCQKNWFWDTVPFDGEQVATSAEVQGDPAHSQVLQGEARQAVEQVMRFENARVENLQAATHRVARTLQPAVVRPNRHILTTTFHRLHTIFRSISPNEQPPSRPAAVLAKRRAEDQQVQRAGKNIITRIIGLGNRVGQQNFTVSNMRSTQPGPVQQLSRPQGPRRTRALETPIVVLDDSDIERGTVGRQNEGRPGRNGAGRGQTNRRTTVIDLTVEDGGIIDLTGDD